MALYSIFNPMVATADIDTVMSLPDIIEQVANLGLMVVVSAVVVYFMIRVMNSLLDHSKQTISQIIPRLENCINALSDVKNVLMSTLNTHNASVNKTLRDIEAMLKEINDKIDNKIENVNSDIETINDNIEKTVDKQSDVLIQLEKIEGVLYTIRVQLNMLDVGENKTSKNQNGGNHLDVDGDGDL